MAAIWGGLGAACCWGVATVSSSRSTRMIGASSVLAWVMIVGLALVAPAALASGVPTISATTLAWLAVSGIGNVLGLFAEYAGLRVGKVGVVAAIASTEGAVAAVIAVVAGEAISPGGGIMLAVIATGVFLAALAPDETTGPNPTQPGRAAALGATAAACFGIGLYAAGRVSQDLPAIWIALAARVAGVALIALPLVATGRLTLRKPAVPFVLLSGVCEVAGFISFSLGARSGIAVTAVLASQFAAVAALSAFVLFHERLARLQLAGVLTIITGVAVLTVLRA